MGQRAGPALSVILVSPGSYTDIEATVRCIRAQTIASQVELVIVATNSADVLVPADHADDLYAVCFVETPVHSLAMARAAAVPRTTATVIAFAEDHSFPEPGWSVALVDAHDRGFAGVAPRMKNANPGTAVSWAAMFLHFGGALEPGRGFETDYPAASHNMSYRRDVLLELGDRLGELLLAELFLHEALRARGHRLWVEPGAATRHINMSRLAPVLHHAWLGGRLYGGLRRSFGAWPLARRLAYAGGAPLIPLLRLTRVLRDIRRTRLGPALPRLLPPMLAMLALHAAGEAAGYLFGTGRSRVAYSDYETCRFRHVQPAERTLWT
jgi:hypothetical protein